MQLRFQNISRKNTMTDSEKMFALLHGSPENWEEACNGKMAYSNLAPSMLSIAVAREDRLLRQIAELKTAALAGSTPRAPAPDGSSFSTEVALPRMPGELDSLLGRYFDAGVAEGREGREHDTADGLAQSTLSEIHSCIKESVSSEREACVALLMLKSADILLMAGEMTAQEMRTTKAVLANRAAAIHARFR